MIFPAIYSDSVCLVFWYICYIVGLWLLCYCTVCIVPEWPLYWLVSEWWYGYRMHVAESPDVVKWISRGEETAVDQFISVHSVCSCGWPWLVNFVLIRCWRVLINRLRGTNTFSIKGNKIFNYRLRSVRQLSIIWQSNFKLIKFHQILIVKQITFVEIFRVIIFTILPLFTNRMKELGEWIFFLVSV